MNETELQQVRAEMGGYECVREVYADFQNYQHIRHFYACVRWGLPWLFGLNEMMDMLERIMEEDE